MRSAVVESEVSGGGFGTATSDAIKEMTATQNRTPLLDNIGFNESSDCPHAVTLLAGELEVNSAQRVYKPKKNILGTVIDRQPTSSRLIPSA
jgi:hypothetical protein